ncbi:hypothetical protein Tco_0798183 [Tanacetum coccineum]
MYYPHWASPPPTESSPISAFNLDDDNFEPLWDSASQCSQYTKGPSEPVEDNSPVEEVAAVKPKRKYTRGRQPIKKNEKEFVEPWTIEEENWANKKEAMIPLTANEKIGFVLRTILNGEKLKCQSFLNLKKSSKKSRISQTTSQDNSDSAHIGLNVNDEAADSDDVEVQEVRPIGRDATKKKGSSSGARSESSVAGDPSLVDALLSKLQWLQSRVFVEEGIFL